MGKLLRRYIFIWFILSVGYFFLAEPLVKLLFPGFHDVGMWLLFEIAGLAFILLIMATLMTINIVRRQRRLNTSS
jgi:uncharacterized membrane protein